MSIVIVGAGDIGAILARRLSAEGKDVVLVDANPRRVRELADSLDVRAMQGRGASPSVLREAGIEEAEMLIAVTESDETNLLACLVASRIALVQTRIARVRDAELAELVPELLPKKEDPIALSINPEREAAEQIARVLDVPGASAVYEFVGGRVRIVAFTVDRPCDAEGLRLEQLRRDKGVEANVVAIARGGRMQVPGGRERIARGDVLYVAGAPEALAELSRLLGKDAREARRLVVFGGGSVTRFLLRRLEGSGRSFKVIESDPDVCESLTKEAPGAVVIRGDATDLALLEEENVDSADVFLALTADDEDNILASILAKRMGVPRVVALVHKTAYVSVVSAIGVDAAVSPTLAAVSAILHRVRRGSVEGVTTLGEEGAEALEIRALKTSQIVGRPLRELDLGPAVVGAIVRGDRVIVPGGDDTIEEEDRVVIVAMRQAIRKLEQSVAVRPDYF